MADENKEQDTVATEPTAPAEPNPAPAPAEPAPTMEPEKPVLESSKTPENKPDAEKKPSEPEEVKEYEQFKLPEGIKLDDNKMKSFIEIAKEFKLTQEQAQKLVDFDAASIKSSEDAFHKMQEDWKNASIKELGENAEQKLGEAALAYKQFGDDEFVKLMKDTGLENHPAVVRAFRKIGSMIATDKTVSATSNGVKSSKTIEEILYGEE